MSSARRSKDNEMAVSTQASVELENMPFCGMLTARGAHSWSHSDKCLFRHFALYATPRHATPPPAPKCASCCLPLWLLMLCCAVLCRAWSALGCAPAHSTQTRRQKPAYMDNLFFRSKFLCPNDYWADFIQPSKPLFASRTSWSAQNLGIVCFFSLSCGREIV